MEKRYPVVHFEMPYEDRDRLVRFYTKAFGWQMNKLGLEMGNYVMAYTTETDGNRMVKTPGTINGGFFPLDPRSPAQHPSVVIAVEDIKEAMKNIIDSGGKVLGEPMTIPGIGLYVSFTDTEGNRSSILQPIGMTQKIRPHLWFDTEAKEAAKFYVSIFKEDSRIKDVTTIHNTPSGSADIVTFSLAGQDFMAINAGPIFKINPSVSFSIACRTKEEVDVFWKELSKGGKVLMELDTYPFSERYGWVQDRYGLSWQIISMGGAEVTQKITPVIFFTQDMAGKAEEAMNFYVSVFKDAHVGDIFRYPTGQEPEKEGTVAHAAFTLEGQGFAAMESAGPHAFKFNEAISFMVICKDQAEIDHYWNRLSAVPEAEQCGWLKDRYGLSWQIVPAVMDEMMRDKDEKKVARVTEAFLKMKKFDIAALERAYRGEV